MASSAMLPYLARVAREAREGKGRKPYNIASTPAGEPGRDPSTVWRFEQGENWPQDADLMIDLYAADLDLEPIELWRRALRLWTEEAARGESPEEALSEGGDQLQAVVESQARTTPARSPKKRPDKRRDGA